MQNNIGKWKYSFMELVFGRVWRYTGMLKTPRQSGPSSPYPEGMVQFSWYVFYCFFILIEGRWYSARTGDFDDKRGMSDGGKAMLSSSKGKVWREDGGDWKTRAKATLVSGHADSSGDTWIPRGFGTGIQDWDIQSVAAADPFHPYDGISLHAGVRGFQCPPLQYWGQL